MTKKTTKDEITEIKTVLNRQKYSNITFIVMFFLITLIIVFCIPQYENITIYETITVKIAPNDIIFTEDIQELCYDNVSIKKIMCDDGITIKKYNSFNDGKQYMLRNRNNEEKKCMINFVMKTRIIR